MRSTAKFLSLKQSEIFESFSPMEMGRLLGIAEEQELPKHHIIFSPGDQVSAIYFIEKGACASVVRQKQAKPCFWLCLARRLIGEAAWDKGTHDSSAETLEETKLYEIGKAAFEDLARSNPDFALCLLQVISIRLKQAQERIEDLVFRQVPSRIARLLLSLAETHGKVTPKGIRVEFRLTHQDIADLVGSSRVTVTQVLNRFRDSQWIDIESKRITIHNSSALEELVHHQ